MPKLTRPNYRHLAVAQGLLKGKSMGQAVRDAGYSPATARNPGVICHSPEVVQALRDLGKQINAEHLDEMARARLNALLADPEVDNRSLIMGVRLAFEVSGRVGHARQTVEHEHKFHPDTIAFMERFLPKPAPLIDAIPEPTTQEN
jgi:hypothetical protein